MLISHRGGAGKQIRFRPTPPNTHTVLVGDSIVLTKPCKKLSCAPWGLMVMASGGGVFCCYCGLLAAVRWRGPIAKVRCRTAVIVMLMIALVVYCSLFWSGRDFRIRLVAHARAPRRPTVCFDPRCVNRSGAVAGFSGAGCARDRACSCSGLVGTSTC